MEPFNNFEGVVVPLDRANVDTDQIIPKQFLKLIGRTGFGKFLFYDWRFSNDGKPNGQFVLNQPRYRDAKILLTRANFGCGSSREHAVWALSDYGLRALIAPSYADIFQNNCFKNGVLPVRLDNGEIEKLFEEIANRDGYALHINLDNQVITKPDGQALHFDLDAFMKKFLMEGLDDISLTLQHEEEIRHYEQRFRSFQTVDVTRL
jgi:3-isopropylmalate/(R)-2-methylmalate dehydratase small subunit